MRFLMAAFSVLLLAGCASVVHVEKDETANLNNYRSYAWIETREDKGDSAAAKLSDLTERRIRQAVDAELAKTG